ncbi:MAG: AAA domain-containing protein [Planctomycetota bacterium]
MPQQTILHNMLDRLYAAIARGPALNCRPHRSRQRIDLADLNAFDDTPPTQVLQQLIDTGSVDLRANATLPPELADALARPPGSLDEDTTQRLRADPDARQYRAQHNLLRKLRHLSDDARTYQQDTGVHALALGYPLLSLPPGTAGGTRRLLAPIALIPVDLTVNTSARPGLTLDTQATGADRLQPNHALLAWIERETGQPLPGLPDLPEDDEAEHPWEEVAALLHAVTQALDIPFDLDDFLARSPRIESVGPSDEDPESDSSGSNSTKPQQGDAASAALETDQNPTPDWSNPPLAPCPSTEDLPDTPAIVPAAVLGLFPASNQGLLRDTRTLIEKPDLQALAGSFLQPQALEQQTQPPSESDTPEGDAASAALDPTNNPARIDFPARRFVTLADPFQSRAAELAASAPALVMHGPPGTGKSQTITNIVADHLARGQRVLFVCDKRTALDVVHHRLDHLGLGDLCALIHDPQRDQRDLYMAIRARLEALPDQKTKPRAQAKVEKIDAELTDTHARLTDTHTALQTPDHQGRTFHRLVGQWLALQSKADTNQPPDLDNLTLDQLDDAEPHLRLLLERGLAIDYPHNPWVTAAGLSLDDLLARPVDTDRDALDQAVTLAQQTDQTLDDTIPPFDPDADLTEQSQRRAALLAALKEHTPHLDPTASQAAAAQPPAAIRAHRQQLTDNRPFLDLLDAGPHDPELALAARDQSLSPTTINQKLRALDHYLVKANGWLSFLAFAAKKQARKALQPFGLPLSLDHATRLRTFLQRFRARLVLSATLRSLNHPGITDATSGGDDTTLRTGFDQQSRLLNLLHLTLDDEPLDDALRAALQQPDQLDPLTQGLRLSPARAQALATLRQHLQALSLLNLTAIQNLHHTGCLNQPLTPGITDLRDNFDTLERVLRIAEALDDPSGGLPKPLQTPAQTMLEAGTQPDAALDAARYTLLTDHLTTRLSRDPVLRRLDPDQHAADLERYAALERDKHAAVRDAVLHHWVSKQQSRLLVGTGSRLNSDGADLRRRLLVRGKRALRLRQALDLGRSIDGGDPLMDMCPVWLASPETVAQAFPLEPVFDVVIFDEASQLRLEEALPVLVRAKRVVIAGDPKQLPPTRFFEAGVSTNDDVDDIETEEDLFEAQQSEVEDLLAAALNLSIEEAHLNVHYRSKHPDLIAFSNQHFYRSRLQPLPSHPSRHPALAPVNLIRADGTYEDRANVIEAQRVADLVNELLTDRKPPSIGIACFNLVQRDLIADTLADRADADPAFAKRLAKAYARTGDDAFEGLFIKNLENVQGDERDHLIISTTYGPKPTGKFHRQFGPLNMPGGGRRLNVLITRARQQIHLVTSIPRDAYRALPPIPEGSTPSGGYLLLAYLAFAEHLTDTWQPTPTPPTRTAPSKPTDSIRGLAGALADVIPKHTPLQPAPANIHPDSGFRIDLTLQSQADPDADAPTREASSTLALLLDTPNFRGAPDPAEWDAYRQGIFTWQGWQTKRLWSPQLFRDLTRSLAQLHTTTP